MDVGSPRRRMFTITFYSYKGGVGRSIALLNTAHQLAVRGRSVALIDFDLEAPGLHSAVVKAWPNAASTLKPEGVLDYLTTYKLRAGETGVADVLDLTGYISGKFGPDPEPRIQLIHAGRMDNGYTQRLAELSIIDFAEEWYGRELLLAMRKQLEEMEFDYLLIDSRTGHTDALGATTVLLPHAVVLLSNLSEQSVAGTVRTLDIIREHGSGPETSGARERPANLLCARDPLDPEIETLVVASPVPFGEQAHLRASPDIVLYPDHILYHVPHIAAHEEAHVIREPRQGAVDPAFEMFSGLVDRLQALDPYEPSALANRGFDSLSRQDWRVALGYFLSADAFLGEIKDPQRRVADSRLRARLWLGQARALALGYQMDHAAELVTRAASVIESNSFATEELRKELGVAQMQLVRGYLGANRLQDAILPSKAALQGATSLADDLRVRDGNHWKLSTGLMAAEASMYGGDYAGAAAQAASLPAHARRLNRRVEMVRARQLRALASLSAAKIRDAEGEASRAFHDAKEFGVPYLIAEAGVALGSVELAAGATSYDGRVRLDRAVEVFGSVGDGYGAANSLCELGLYIHRLGPDITEVREKLSASLAGFQAISGSALGEITSLLYATRALLDCGNICVDLPPSARNELAHGRRGAPLGFVPPLNPAVVGRTLPRAAETLVLAAYIAHERNVHFLDDLIGAYWTELELFADPNWLKYVLQEFGFESAPSRVDAPHYPAVALEVERSWELATMLHGPVDADRLLRLGSLATRAQQIGADYDRAATLTLVALGHEAQGDESRRRETVEELCRMHEKRKLSWAIWGHVRCVRDNLRAEGRAPAWRRAAAAVLEGVRTLGLPSPP